MPKNRRFLRRTAALILAVLLLAAAMPSALAADTRTGTVSAPDGHPPSARVARRRGRGGSAGRERRFDPQRGDGRERHALVLHTKARRRDRLRPGGERDALRAGDDPDAGGNAGIRTGTHRGE